jgi:hypothetical protein
LRPPHSGPMEAGWRANLRDKILIIKMIKVMMIWGET